jgi:lipopolysaccharide/colanic/teichoic acid biosynthesis glycosyltransferase
MSYDQQKRILDLIVASILIVAFLPFWIIIPILIFFDSGWPVIFTHKRVGKNGIDFKLYKFRSMVLNADEILHQKNHQLLKQFKNGDWKMLPKMTHALLHLADFYDLLLSMNFLNFSTYLKDR